jgi:hypothetical protein
MLFFLDAATLSRIRSPVTSRSNWAKDKRTFSVSRPMLVVLVRPHHAAAPMAYIVPPRTTAMEKWLDALLREFRERGFLAGRMA